MLLANHKRQTTRVPSEDHALSGQVERLEERIMLSTVEVFAAGHTTQENFDLLVDDVVVATYENVAGDPAAQQFERFVFETNESISADQVAIAFTNDLYDAANGIDRNLVVDKIVVDGVSFETESPTTHSTGIWQDGATGPGYFQTEWMNINGVISFAGGATGGATEISVDAFGFTGDEMVDVQVDGNLIASFDVTSQLDSYSVTLEEQVSADRIRIAFTNDAWDGSTGYDRNLVIDQYRVTDVESGQTKTIHPHELTVFSTGTWIDQELVDGFGRGDTLHNNGYFQLTGENADAGRLIRFYAHGETGTEMARVTTKDGQMLGEFQVEKGDRIRYSSPAEYVDREYQLTTDRAVDLDDIRIEFVNDGIDSLGNDRNLRINGVVVETLDGSRAQRTTTLDNQTWSTGIYYDGGVIPGFERGNTLHVNGYFEFQESSRVLIPVRGDTGSEVFNVLIDGQVVETFTASAAFGETVAIDIDGTVTDSDVRIEFVNDGLDSFGEDRNLHIGRIDIDGRAHSPNGIGVESSETISSSLLFWKVLYSNGYIQFGSNNDPGEVGFFSLSNSVSGSLADGIAELQIERLGEKDGDVQFDYRVVPLSNAGDIPVANPTGTITLRDDQSRSAFTIYFPEAVSNGAFTVELTNPSNGLTFNQYDDSIIVSVS